MKNLLNEKTLFKIIEDEKCELLENAIKLGADINTIDDETGNTPIHFALEIAEKNNYSKNSIEIINKLLDLDADINKVNYKTGETPLHIAVKKCQTPTIDIIQRFIELGACVDARNNLGQTPLFVLASSPESSDPKNFAVLDCARLLIFANADIYAKVPVDDHRGVISPLNIVDPNFKENLFKIFVEEAPVFKPDVDKSSPYSMYSLATNNNLVPLQALKKNPSIVNNLDESGLALLHYATLAGRKDIIEILVKDYGAYVDIQDKFGNTPLHLAAMNCDWANNIISIKNNVINPLKILGADFNIRNNNCSLPSELVVPKDKRSLFLSFGTSNISALISKPVALDDFKNAINSELDKISILCMNLVDKKIDFINNSKKYSSERKNSILKSLVSHKSKFNKLICNIKEDVSNIPSYETLRHVVRHANYLKFCYNLDITDGNNGTAIWDTETLPKNIHDKLKNLTSVIKNIKSMSQIPKEVNRQLEIANLRRKFNLNTTKDMTIDI